jgi:hypothetical protein
VNFRTRPDPCFGVSTMHFPTIWKAADVEDLDQYLGGLTPELRPEWVLGYNEPNFAYGGTTIKHSLGKIVLGISMYPIHYIELIRKHGQHHLPTRRCHSLEKSNRGQEQIWV